LVDAKSGGKRRTKFNIVRGAADPPIKIAAAIHYAIAPSLGVPGGLDAAEGGF